MKKAKEKIMEAMTYQGCFVFEGGPFTSSAGFKVPFFIDVRRLFSDPKILSLISEEFSKICKRNKIDVIAGAETAGIPFAAITSVKADLPFFYIRKTAQDHGLKSVIAGYTPKKEKNIAIIDDSIGAGGSVKLFIENLIQEGFNPKLFLCVLDMNLFEGSEINIWEKLKRRGINSAFLVTWQEWINYMCNEGIISKRLRDICLEVAKNPLFFSDEKQLLKYYKEKQEGLIWFKLQRE